MHIKNIKWFLFYLNNYLGILLKDKTKTTLAKNGLVTQHEILLPQHFGDSFYCLEA